MDRSDSSSRPDPPSIPEVVHDEERLRALEQQDILYTEPEPAFDRITRLAIDLLGVPVALVNFVGDDRQWFKSKAGFDETETGLDVSFCVYTIEEQGPTVIENAAEDERFASNPYVKERGLRFYAGVPLEVGDGQRIGTLCVLDTEARALSDESLRQLTDLAAMVEDELQLRREATRRRRSEQQKEMQSTFLESIATGTPADDVLGELCREVERWMPGARVSILQLDEDRLRHVAAPSLPTEYVEAIDGLAIGPSVATCGTAAHTGETVIAEDISDDERWDGYRDLISGTHLRSCWSVPIRSRSSEVLGTFAVYATEPRGPSTEERRLINRMAHVASVALEHERREEALRKSEERFRTVVEHARPVVFMTDADGILVLSEGEDLEALGLRPGQAVGESVFEIFDGYPEVTDRVRRVLRGEEVEAEVEIDGTLLKAWASPFHDEEGTVAGCIGMATDVTEQRTRERQLATTKERYRTLIEHFPGAVFLYDDDLQCVLTGGKAIDEIGMNREEIEGASPLERYPPEIAEPLADRLQDALDGERSVLEQSFQRRHFRVETVPVRKGETCMAVSLDVTERKRAETALEEREARLRGIANSIPGVVYQFYVRPDGDDGCHFISDRAEDVLGIRPDPATFHDRFTEGIPASHRQSFLDAIENAAEKKAPFRFEMPFERPDGDTRWLLDVSMPEARDSEVVFNGVLLDVTERKEAEQARSRMTEAIEVASNGIALLDEEGVYTYVNQAHTEIFGYDTPSAFLGNTWRMCYAEPQIERFEETIMPTLREEGTWQGEVPGKRDDGTQFPQQVTLTRLTNGGLICVTQDITARKHAERELQLSERRFRKVYENAAIGIAIGNDEGRIQRSNPAFQSMLGCEGEELEGLHFSEMTHPDDVESDLDLFEELIEGKRDRYQIEKRYVHKDGEVFWVRLTVSLLDLDDGKKPIALVEDIDEQKHYEEQLRTAKREAEEAARLKSVMLANMSHEVRTPLTSMIGFSGLLSNRLDGKAAKLARLIQKSGKRLEDTMEAVLQLSQLEAGSYTLDREPLSLASLARRLTDEFELQAQESDVSMQVEVAGESVEAYADETAVRRIISNLLDNAIKFTPDGGTVWIRVYVEETTSVVAIEDTGVGIAEKAQSDVFRAFKQESEGLTREYEGAGLGLAIAQELVTVLGGTIGVDSEKGEGTRMTVRLPRPKDRADHG
jgi:PAS domain S-box-containing protein